MLVNWKAKVPARNCIIFLLDHVTENSLFDEVRVKIEEEHKENENENELNLVESTKDSFFDELIVKIEDEIEESKINSIKGINYLLGNLFFISSRTTFRESYVKR